MILLIWSIGSSLYSFPHELSYCNELVGGSKNVYKYLAKSDSSWGQDLLFLKKWMDSHPEVKDLHLAHSGPFDPRIAGIEFTLPPRGINGKKCIKTIPSELLGPQPGWYAIEVCFLLGGDPLSAADGNGSWEPPSRIEGYDLSYFLNFEPITTAGYSIYIYHITLKDANRIRREMRLTEIEACLGMNISNNSVASAATPSATTKSLRESSDRKPTVTPITKVLQNH